MKITLKILILALLVFTQVYGYSEDLSKRMINLSRAVYHISKADQAANRCPQCYKGFTVLKEILGNNILAVIGVDHQLQAVAVSFRGSDNVANFLTDANIGTVKYEDDKICQNCKVHRGFYNSYVRLGKQGLKAAIDEAVNSNPSYQVFFTGHSLGGAVANLAAAGFRQEHPSATIKLYTYGQPRVGNGDFADYVNKKVPENYRVVHQKDIVPHKPAYFINYRHSGTEIWYKDGMVGDYIVCKDESNNCSNGLGYTDFRYSVKDHSSDNYIQLKDKAQIVKPVKSSRKTASSPNDDEWVEVEYEATFSGEEFAVSDSDLFDGSNQDDL